MDDRAAGPVVVFLAREGRAERLLAEHLTDATGHCTVCLAGPQAGRKRWPCLLVEYATAAREMAESAG